MPFPPTQKTMEGLLKDNLERLTLVERRLAIGGSGGSTPYDAEPGMIMPFGGTTIPDGWLLCDGSAVSRNTYSKLFTVIGTAYGVGDGTATFNLPNLKGRVPVGHDTAQAEFDVMGEAGGAKAHTLTIAEMPNHQHTEGWAGVNASASYGVAASAPSGNINQQSGQNTAFHAQTSLVGGGAAHNNMPPYQVTKYIISTGDGVGGGTALSSGGGGGTTIVQSGLVLLRPTSVQGATIDGNQVKFTNSAGVSINNIFDAALYDDYVIEVRINAVPSGGYLRMRKNGVDTVANTYGNQQTWNSANNVWTTQYGAHPGWIFANSIGLEQKFTVYLSRPTSVNPESIFADIQQIIQVADGLREGSTRGTHTGQGYDGFTIQPAAGTISGTITIYGKSKMAGPAVAQPTNQWQELSLAKPGGLRPLVSGYIAWDGVITGNLGVTLNADKTTFTLPSAGTYRILTHLGIGATTGQGTAANLELGGTGYAPSLDYGNAGAAGVYVSHIETVITTTGPQTVRQWCTPGGMYDWTWLRIEKLDPVAFGIAPVVQQGSTSERDARYGVPATDQTKASLANQVISWFNTDKGWYETYYATTGTAGLTKPGLRTGHPSGWYPAAGSPIYCAVRRGPSQAINATWIDIGFDQLLSNHGFVNPLPAPLTMPVGGDYEFTMSAVASQAASNYLNLGWSLNGAIPWFESGAVYPHAGGYSRSVLEPTIYPFKQGDTLAMRAQTSSTGNIEGGTARISVRYISPPFAP